MVCKKAPGKIARHQVLNDVIWRALNAAGIPATKEPLGTNGKRPDGLTLTLWQGGKPLVPGRHSCQHVGRIVRRHCRRWHGTGG